MKFVVDESRITMVINKVFSLGKAIMKMLHIRGLVCVFTLTSALLCWHSAWAGSSSSKGGKSCVLLYKKFYGTEFSRCYDCMFRARNNAGDKVNNRIWVEAQDYDKAVGALYKPDWKCVDTDWQMYGGTIKGLVDQGWKPDYKSKGTTCKDKGYR